MKGFIRWWREFTAPRPQYTPPLSLAERRAQEALAAEARWREHNAEAYAKGCRCGGPAEVVKEDHRTLGRVPHESWACKAHAYADGWSGTVPFWRRPTPCNGCGVTRECATRSFRMGSDTPTSFGCELPPWEGE